MPQNIHLSTSQSRGSVAFLQIRGVCCRSNGRDTATDAASKRDLLLFADSSQDSSQTMAFGKCHGRDQMSVI